MTAKLSKYLLIILCVFMASCSTEKKLKKAIKNHGAKESALLIVRLHPEYFKTDSVKIDTTLKVPIETETPEIKNDSSFVANKDSCLKTFRFKDKFLEASLIINGDSGKFSYKIAPQIVRDTVKIPFKVTEPCPPCPEAELIEEMNKELLKKETEIAKAKSKSWFAQFRDVWFYISIVLLVGYLYLKFKPL